ncbi:MAG: dihydropteroate synthase [bacterium]|nr:dihydropteroate synthase [bacterium]
MKTKVMGVLHLTPDAFAASDRSPTRAAVTRGRRMIADGADILEVNCPAPAGEPAPAEGAARVVAALAGDVRVAVATGSPELAAAATAAGATLICDASGAVSVPAGPGEALVGVAADTGAGWVAAPAPASEGNSRPSGAGSVLAETLRALETQVARLSAAGLREIYLDPGIGGDRAVAEDLDLLGGMERLATLGRPLVVGVDDGRLIDELHAAADTRRLAESAAAGDRWADRLEGALAVAVWAMLAGAAVLRTRHVAATVQAARTVGAKQPAGPT